MKAPSLQMATSRLSLISISPQHAAMMDRSRRDTSVLSMDDLEAAQALEGLRSGMFYPESQNIALPSCFGITVRRTVLILRRQISDNLLEHRDNPFPSLHRTHHQSHSCLCLHRLTRSSPLPLTAQSRPMPPPNHTHRDLSLARSSSSAILGRPSQTPSAR